MFFPFEENLHSFHRRLAVQKHIEVQYKKVSEVHFSKMISFNMHG